ncbi:branched-chain amino acid aminotransferase [Pseudonocardia phyllosphaerae]|uniref:branched-chain amino acid aminotransferase n=1 Tax=Pseudonocardia phyllosphaerae TaxID=3390502 RepID=UPI00397C21DB
MDYSDRDGHIWLDGQLVEWKAATFHVLTHGLHYASSVFEGIRVYDGIAFALEQHQRRLLASAAALRIDIPFTVDELCAATAKLVSELGVANGYVRPVSWRGSGSIEVPGFDAGSHTAIAIWDWPSVFGNEARVAGIRLGTSRWRRPDPATAPTHAKAASNYAIGTLARHEVAERGFDDALLLDWQGRLAEATGANLFLVHNGSLHTPIADCFLAGITRATVMELAEKHKIPVVERRIWPEEINDADEVFLTGTAYEVQPVRAIDDKVFSPGPVTRVLQDAYQAIVRRVEG